jgi:hypothetical protein
VSTPASKPRDGRVSPLGGWNLNFLPSLPTSSSTNGLKRKSPPKANAVTSSGEVTNAWVCGLASLRAVKLRLYDVTIVFFSPFLTSCLCFERKPDLKKKKNFF